MRIRRYTKWTEEELSRLRVLALAGLRVKTIARHLRRTADAVRAQSRQNGIALREDRLLAECRRAGVALGDGLTAAVGRRWRGQPGGAHASFGTS